ncbi:putative HPt domain-containing protein [Azospirillaceae bacterium]
MSENNENNMENDKITEIEFIPPNFELRQRAMTTGGISLKDALARANARVQELSKEYIDVLEHDLGRLLEAEATIITAPLELREAAIKKLFLIAHEVKGQAGTFDYQLITDIADSLCSFLTMADMQQPKYFEAIRCHIASLQLVTERRIQGSGGEIERHLLKSLKNAVMHITHP